jgi:hypothetical protein
MDIGENKLDASDIENAAIRAVEDSSYFIKSFLNSGDKEPVWDGNIYFYKTENRKSNDQILGKIETQVKGREVQVFSEKELSYDISVNDLKLYRKDKGIIFFVVEVKENRSTKIFYKILLPLDIDEILKGKLEQQTVRVHFEYMESPERVYQYFLDHSSKQGGEATLTVDKAERIHKFIITNKENFFKDTIKMLTEQQYTYGGLEAVKGIIPIGKTSVLDLIEGDEEVKNELKDIGLDNILDNSSLNFSKEYEVLYISYTIRDGIKKTSYLILNKLLEEPLGQAEKMMISSGDMLGVDSIIEEVTFDNSDSILRKIKIDSIEISFSNDCSINIKFSESDGSVLTKFFKEVVTNFENDFLTEISISMGQVIKKEEKLIYIMNDPIVFS